MIWINLPKYLIDFVKSQSEMSDDAIRINRDSFIGGLIYDRLEKVPDGCIFKFDQAYNRFPLKVSIKDIGGRNEKRIYARDIYYITPQNQRTLEALLVDYFNNLFYNTLDLTIDSSEEQIKLLIEKFCLRYNIDFLDCYEMLKKRYFRYRKSKFEKTLY